MSKSATMDALELLHSQVAKVLTEQLKESSTEITPQTLAQAIKFLKDNRIEAAKDADHSALNSLAEQVRRFQSGEDDASSYLN